MTRLYRKGLIDRRLESIRGGHHYLYRATMTKSMFIGKIGKQILMHLQNCFGAAVLRSFFGRNSSSPLNEG
jgi:predicted transcriptional regulator